MSTRPDNLESVRFALELLRRIPRQRKVTAREIHAQLVAEGFDRDIRTVQRQLDVLSEHFDIERDDRSKPFGYKWKDRAEGISLPAMTEKEALLLTLAEEHLRNLLPASLMRSMSGFFTQAQGRLSPQGGAQREREWVGKVRVVRETQPLLPPRIAPGVFDVVSNALYADRWLSLDYRNANGRLALVNVMPLGLAQQGPRLYLVCRFDGFDNERSLALHRIAKAEMGAVFVRPRDFDLKQYDDDGRFGFGEGRRITLVIKIDKATGQHLLESPLSADQKVEESVDSFEITASVIESEQLRWWLRGFGDALTVKAPRGLLSRSPCKSE